MDSKQYITDAIRTESRIDKVNVFDETVFVDAVRAFVASAAILDMFKKNIFYGKPINEVMWADKATELVQASKWLSSNSPFINSGRTQQVSFDPRVLHAIVGIATEAGELMEVVDKKLRWQHKVDGVNVLEEIGDLNWYEAILIDALNGDWDNIREKNIAKLRARYPDKFDADKAINRDVAAERKILEGDARSMPGVDEDGGSDF